MSSPSDGPAKRVVVVGAGPAGLEAARVTGERGHDVVLFEAAPDPGGQVRLAARLQRRREITGIADWRAERCLAEFTQRARNPARSVPIGGNNTMFSPTNGAPFVRDLDYGPALRNDRGFREASRAARLPGSRRASCRAMPAGPKNTSHEHLLLGIKAGCRLRRSPGSMH